MIEYPLSTPIEVHGQTLTVLSLREASSENAIKIGKLPYSINADQSVDIVLPVAVKYLAHLANVPPSSIAQLALSDLNSLAWTVAGFFLKPDVATSSS